MLFRTSSRKPSRRPPPPPGKAPIFGLAAVAFLAIVLAYLWTSRRALRSGAPVPPVAAQSTPAQAAPAAPAFTPRHIYSDTANPRADIAAALAQAARQHKRVLLDFGGDWCPDCQVLDFYLHQPPNADLLDKNFVLVHVWIGQMDANLDLAASYGVPIARGVPALAVLDAGGKLLYAQKSGEFNKMSHMEPASVTEFLETWKG